LAKEGTVNNGEARNKRNVADYFSRQTRFWKIIYAGNQDEIDTFYNTEIINRKQAVLRFIGEHAGNNAMKILDAGCGSGVFVDELLKLGHIVVGMDIATEMIRETSRISEENPGAPVLCVQGDIEKLTTPPAIVLGCHKIGLGVIRALGAKNVPVVGVYYNAMDMGCVSKYVIARYQCPHPDQDEQGFLSFLLGLAAEWGGAVLVPSDDATLIPVSRHKNTLEAHFKVVADKWQVTEQAIFKQHTYALADKIGVPSPATKVPESMEDAIDFVKGIGFPCLLKPTVGHTFFQLFRRKMILAHELDQLREAYRKTEEAGVEMMIQEFIPGDDKSGVNYNSFFLNGRPLLEVTAEKVRLTPPYIGFPRVVVSKYIPEVLDSGRSFLRALGYNGFSCMEFKKDARNGIYKLMEINARLNLSTPLSVRAGINFPYVAYRYALNGELPEPAAPFKEGIYWIDIGKDISESIKSFGKERISPTEYLRPYLKPHVFTILSLNDPMPLAKRALDIVRALPKALARGLHER